MPSSHTITTRPATEDELLALGVRADAHPLLNGCLVLVVCALPVTMLFVLIIGFTPPGQLSPLQAILRFIGFVLAAWFAIAIVRGLRKDQSGALAIAKAELEAGVVEELSVQTDRALLYHPYDGVDVGLAIEIAPGRALLFAGGVMMDESVFTDPIEWPEDLQLPEGLRVAVPFPTTEFTVVRTPRSGYVFEIGTGGAFLMPEVHAIPRLVRTDAETRLVEAGIDALIAGDDTPPTD